MNEKDNRVRMSKRNFIAALLLLLLTNILMGITLMTMAKRTLRKQIEQRMLDVANSASAQLDGDELKTVAPNDKNSEAYKKAYNTLHKFKDNIELEYIYALYPMGDDKFTFGIDPDDENPCEYGKLVEATPALKNAARGKADVDKSPYSDDWGRFYSAYSPYFDSEGNVVGIVVVDFDADWYDDTLKDHRAATVIITMVALTIGIVLSFVIMSQNRKRFSRMLNSMADLDVEMQKLDNVIMQSSIKKLDMIPDSENRTLKALAAGEENKTTVSNEYDEMYTSIDAIHKKLQKYLKFIDSEVYIDSTTGVKNKIAYKMRINELDEQIAAGNANFSVAFFDINGLKKIYTNNGYEAGELIMFECAKLLKSIFGKANVYHITGDEFVVLLDGKSRFDMEDYFKEFDKSVQKYNTEHIMENQLSVARGSATFDKEQYSDYRHVFIDAEARCMKNKADHYNKGLF